MSICKICNQNEARKGKLGTCVKCYHQEYSKKNYVKKEKSCAICGKVSFLNKKKYCDECRPSIKSVCVNCGKEFYWGAKYKYCTTCQYHLNKEKNPEGHKVWRKRCNEKYNAKLREMKGLPIDHIFPKGPRGMGYLNKKGYLLVTWRDPKDGKIKRKYHHVVVMMHILGRELRTNERVHHKNGIRNDNRPENLELWNLNGGQPAGQRVEDKIKWAIEFLEEYGYKVSKE